MEHSKIKIKVGQIEVEFEGSEEFIKEELMLLVETVADLQTGNIPTSPSSEVESQNVDTSSSGTKGWGISSYAAKLKVQTGTDLIEQCA